jgi:hypothetical protein
MVCVTAELQPTPDCLAFERFGETMTDVERAHVRTCARCEAEQALWESFQQMTPAADDGAAVQWVVAELRRRRSPAAVVDRRRWRFGLWRPSIGLAVLVLAVGGYWLLDRAPAVDSSLGGSDAYRAAVVTPLEPMGDVRTAPTELSWVAVDGALHYEVRVLEVDQNPLWNITTQATRAQLPLTLVSRFVPGKTVLWSVAAIDRSSRVMAESGTQAFRVAVSPQ